MCIRDRAMEDVSTWQGHQELDSFKKKKEDKTGVTAWVGPDETRFDDKQKKKRKERDSSKTPTIPPMVYDVEISSSTGHSTPIKMTKDLMGDPRRIEPRRPEGGETTYDPLQLDKSATLIAGPKADIKLTPGASKWESPQAKSTPPVSYTHLTLPTKRIV